MRGFDYLSFVGDTGWFGNVELRFPLIEAMATPIGILGGIRGAFFFNIGGAWYNDLPYNFWTDKDEDFQPIVDYRATFTGIEPVYGPTQTISGFRLRDGRASYGVSLETFALGFPIHFDWSWRTTFNKQWEDAFFAYQGGSSWFRRAKFDLWIGYDF
jgi:outer membrane protein assembly factor BamA